MTYTPDSNYNGTDNFTYTVQDDSDATSDPTTVTLNITPVNDAPELNVNDISAIEDGNAVTGQANFTDIDLTDSHTYSVSAMEVGQGTVSIDSTSGEYTYKPGNDFQNLGLGETTDVTFDITIDDGQGGTDTETVTVNITGTNDAPTAVADTDIVDEDASVIVDVLANDTDLDASHTFTLDSVSAPKGTASIDENNQLVFLATGFDSLGEGQTEDVIVTYIMSDENGATSTSSVTITVTGTNDLPIANVDTGSVEEDSSVTIDVLANDTDLDENHSFTLDSVSVAQGDASIDENNQLVFTATGFDYLNAGETEDVIVTYVMSDENGDTSTSSAVITVTGTNDTAEVTAMSAESSSSNDLLVGDDNTDTLIVGLGDDIVTGDSNANTFVWQSGDTGTDHITNFSASEGDKLDLTDILHVDDTHTLSDYLHLSSDGTNTTIEIFVDGDANEEGSVEQTIILDGVNTDSVIVVNNLFDGDSAGPLIIVDDQTVDYGNGVVVPVPDEQHL